MIAPAPDSPVEERHDKKEPRCVMSRFSAAVGFAAVLSFATPVLAADFEATVVIKDHVFIPAEIKVPVGVRIVLTVDNQDPTPEEFESSVLKVEKIIPGNSSAKVRIGALAAGTFHFFGEFNEATAQGVIIAE